MKEVGILLKVGSAGLDNIDRLGKGLRDAGVDTDALEKRAAELRSELDALSAASRRYSDTERDARKEASDARRELEAKRTALELLRLETDRAAKKTAEYETAERALRLGVIEARTALREKQAAVAAAADAARNAAVAEKSLVEQIKQVGSAAATAAAQQTDASRGVAAAAAASGKAQTAANAEVQGGLKLIQDELNGLQRLVGVAIGGGLLAGIAKDLATTADEYANLSARIKLATGDGQAFDAALEGVFEVAKRTNSGLQETGQLFTKLVEAGKAVNLTQRDALALTETVNQATQLSGASAEASRAAITQLVQGLQSGVLRGDEFNSVMEQSPRLAKALADGLGVTTGELRKLAEAGQLTSQAVIQSLQGQSSALQREFEQLPATVGRALQNLGTEWTRYVGQVDQANGVSSKAAAAIGFLANNLTELATAARFAGEAWLAYRAINLAANLLAEGSAIRAAALATQQQTLAVTANTAAKVANAQATTATAAANTAAAASARGVLATIGRFGGVVGAVATGVALYGDIAVNAFRSAGTWIGEAAAKLAGYKDRTDEVTEAQARQDRSARALAQQTAELAQQYKLAADKAVGLTDESRKLVGEFDEARKKGETVVDALAKVQQGLQLKDVSGIRAAVTALDALERQGKITADQLRTTLGTALKGVDLGSFEAQAKAAFDGSEQGARRLQAAIDAVGDEALRRAGTSVRELQTGFSEASTSAINDLDALTNRLKALGLNTDDTKRALAGALDQALAAAKTEKAVQALTDRIDALGKIGLLAGEQITESLEKARKKIEELKPGVNSLDEALRNFGLKTATELQATAARLKASYELIAQSVDLSLTQKAQAFAQYRDAAIAANKGVESSQVALQRVMLQTKLEAAGLGDAVSSAMSKARTATDAAGGSLSQYETLLRSTRVLGGADGLAGAIKDPRLTGVRDAGGKENEVNGFGFQTGNRGRAVNDKLLDVRGESGQVPRPPGDPADFMFVPFPANYGNGIGEWRLSPAGAEKARAADAALLARGGGGYVAQPDGSLRYVPPASSAPAPAAASAGQGAGGRYEITINVGGQRNTVYTDTQAQADALLGALERAFGTGGG